MSNPEWRPGKRAERPRTVSDASFVGLRGCEFSCPSVSRRVRMDVIDHKHGRRTLRCFQLESELLLKGFEQRDGAAWVRCFWNSAGRWRTAAAEPGLHVGRA